MWLIYVLWPVFTIASAVFARRRGRSTLGWLLLGVLFGPFAFGALFVLPDLAEAPSQPTHQEVGEDLSPDFEKPGE